MVHFLQSALTEPFGHLFVAMQRRVVRSSVPDPDLVKIRPDPEHWLEDNVCQISNVPSKSKPAQETLRCKILFTKK